MAIFSSARRGPNPSAPRLWRRLPSIALALVAWLAVPGASLGADAVGEVNEARGRSMGFLAGAVRRLEAGAEIYLDELLRTTAGARLALQLGPRTRLRLGERTQIRIDKAVVEQGGDLVLERGALLFDRPGDAGDAPFVVRTPFAIIATRGTRFFVGPSNDVLGVFCERGRVVVRNAAGQVTLDPGEGTDLVAPDVAPTPPRPWGAERVARALASVS
jgi:ferric-dicitrate binding protein FerR (iron transport regulator)